MNNTRFATAIHILSLLAQKEADWISSDWIASSININPVMVRKELILLQNAGFVIGKKGKEGGFKLNQNPDKISFADVYLKVKNSEILGKRNNHTNPNCAVGKVINKELDGIFFQVEKSVINTLSTKTLAEFIQEFA